MALSVGPPLAPRTLNVNSNSNDGRDVRSAVNLRQAGYLPELDDGMSNPQELRDAFEDWLIHQHHVNLDSNGEQISLFDEDSSFSLLIDFETQVEYTCNLTGVDIEAGLDHRFGLRRCNDHVNEWDKDLDEKDGLERMKAAAEKYGLQVTMELGVWASKPGAPPRHTVSL